jgi:hypothetical protein
LDSGPGRYIPVWETSPVLKINLVDYNRVHLLLDQMHNVAWTREKLSSENLTGPTVGGIDSEDAKTARYASLLGSVAAAGGEEGFIYTGGSLSDIFLPVSLTHSMRISARLFVAVLTATVNWKGIFRDIFQCGRRFGNRRSRCTMTPTSLTYEVD